jgi:hypothetical protein
MYIDIRTSVIKEYTDDNVYKTLLKRKNKPFT